MTVPVLPILVVLELAFLGLLVRWWRIRQSRRSNAFEILVLPMSLILMEVAVISYQAALEVLELLRLRLFLLQNSRQYTAR